MKRALELIWLSLKLLLIAYAISVLSAGCGSPRPCCGTVGMCPCFDARDNAADPSPSCDGRCLTLKTRVGGLRCMGPVK